MINTKLIKNTMLVCLLAAMAGFFMLPAALAQTAAIKDAQVDTGNAGLAVRVAPGELLPISVKLSNFGGNNRVDVLITYGIFANNGNGDQIYLTNETVAVETTASFVKTIQIPFGTAPGIYIAKTSIIYGGQLVPATTQFSFTVEKKIFGLFQGAFFLHGGVTLLVVILALVLVWIMVKRRRKGRFTPFDYSNIPRDKRIFYEILSDTIMQMRQRVGDDALLIASQIDGLKINEETGRIISIAESPSKVIAVLVLEYEKKLDKKVSFSFRN
jgi:hypothetical protein